MFTFSRLGSFGRFGNQLFQIAATVGLATKHGVDYVFPKWEYANLFKVPIPQADPLPKVDFVLTHRSYRFIDFGFMFNEPYVIDLCGVFQSEKFFAGCVDQIRAYFEPCAMITSALRAEYGGILDSRPTCIVVVRRGDFVERPEEQPPQTREFYEEAMSLFDRGTTFFVTSDDIAWCYENIKGPDVVYLPQSTWIQNFFLGTLCQHAIIANSTFGWWFAYLIRNPDKRVVAAKRWFGPAKINRDARDLLPQDWIIV